MVIGIISIARENYTILVKNICRKILVRKLGHTIRIGSMSVLFVDLSKLYAMIIARRFYFRYKSKERKAIYGTNNI